MGDVALSIGTMGRWLGYVGLFGSVGGLVAAWLANRALATEFAVPLERRALRVAAGLSLCVVAALPARLTAQVRAFAEEGEPWAGAARSVLGSGWGAGFKYQVAAAIALTAALVWAAGAGRYRRGRGAAALALAVAATLALVRTGHAAEFSAGATVGVIAQGAHLMGGALWLGTLAVLVLVVACDDLPVPTLRPVLVAFAPVALTGAALVLAGGAALAWSGVRSLGALTSTVYGRLVLGKIAIAGMIALLGAHHWRRAVPALDGKGGVPADMRRSLMAEVLLALGVLAVAAVLSETAAPGLE